MELFLVLAIFLLAAGGLALGLAFGRDPVETSCGGAAKCGRACEICPNRRPTPEGEA